MSLGRTLARPQPQPGLSERHLARYLGERTPGQRSPAHPVVASGAGCPARRAQPVAGRRGGAIAAGGPARPMLRPVALRAAGAVAGPAPPGGTRAIAEQSGAAPVPRSVGRRGAISVGRTLSGPG